MVVHGANMFSPSFSFDVEIGLDHVVKVEVRIRVFSC